MNNPHMKLEDYAKRHYKRWGFDMTRFCNDAQWLDPILDVSRLRALYVSAIQGKLEYLPGEPTYLVAPESLTGHQPEVFCRQPERREHAGGTPGVGFEANESVQTVEFDYSAVDGDYSDEQRAHAVTATEMLLWLQEPLLPELSFCAAGENMLTLKHHVLLLILCPESLGNPTLTQLAVRLGTSKQTLGKISKDFQLRYPEVQTSWMKNHVAATPTTNLK
jgi:hypothetical protein